MTKCERPEKTKARSAEGAIERESGLHDRFVNHQPRQTRLRPGYRAAIEPWRLVAQRRTRYTTGMFRSLLTAALITLPSAAFAADQALAPGRWDVTSTTVEMSVPGLPAFVARMMQGKSKAEHKRLSAGQGVEALIAPDPKAGCHVDVQHVADGKYDQALTCPQKRGGPAHVSRAGTYDKTGFVGRATITGTTPKGPLRIVLSQRAARVGD